jgi:hypothetical protein
MRVYARQAKNRELEADAFEIRERAEIRLGELIEAQKTKGLGLNKGAAGKPGPGRGNKNALARDEGVSPPRLQDAGINFDLSSRAQKKAKLPLREAERLIEKVWENIIKGRPARNILQARREEERENRLKAVAAPQRLHQLNLIKQPARPLASPSQRVPAHQAQLAQIVARTTT